VTTSDGPALRYYRSLEGAWSGRLVFEITDTHALRTEKASVALPVASMALLSYLTGPSRMSTTLAAGPDPEGRTFVHTTRVEALGVTAFETSEVISVREDGESFHVAGTQRSWLGRPQGYEATGEIDASGTAATYRVPWFGTLLVQRTRIETGTLSLAQETRWSRANVVLARRG